MICRHHCLKIIYHYISIKSSRSQQYFSFVTNYFMLIHNHIHNIASIIHFAKPEPPFLAPVTILVKICIEFTRICRLRWSRKFCFSWSEKFRYLGCSNYGIDTVVLVWCHLGYFSAMQWTLLGKWKQKNGSLLSSPPPQWGT